MITSNQRAKPAPAQDPYDGDGGQAGTSTVQAGPQRPPEQKITVTDLAGALAELAASYLRGKITTAGNADVYQVIIHTTPQALAGDAEVGAGTFQPERLTQVRKTFQPERPSATRPGPDAATSRTAPPSTPPTRS